MYNSFIESTIDVKTHKDVIKANKMIDDLRKERERTTHKLKIEIDLYEKQKSINTKERLESYSKEVRKLEFEIKSIEKRISDAISKDVKDDLSLKLKETKSKLHEMKLRENASNVKTISDDEYKKYKNDIDSINKDIGAKILDIERDIAKYTDKPDEIQGRYDDIVSDIDSLKKEINTYKNIANKFEEKLKTHNNIINRYMKNKITKKINNNEKMVDYLTKTKEDDKFKSPLDHKIDAKKEKAKLLAKKAKHVGSAVAAKLAIHEAAYDGLITENEKDILLYYLEEKFA